MSYKSGFVSIVGRPNVGKSTLLNHILKTKLVITSPTAQTTRNTVQGVYTDDEAQIVFVDTPGIHKPQSKLGEFMNTAATDSLKEVEAVLFLVAANEKRGPGDNFIMEQLPKAKAPVFLVINKIDTIDKKELAKVIASYQDAYPFTGVIPISALNGDKIEELYKAMFNKFN